MTENRPQNRSDRRPGTAPGTVAPRPPRIQGKTALRTGQNRPPRPSGPTRFPLLEPVGTDPSQGAEQHHADLHRPLSCIDADRSEETRAPLTVCPVRVGHPSTTTHTRSPHRSGGWGPEGRWGLGASAPRTGPASWHAGPVPPSEHRGGQAPGHGRPVARAARVGLARARPPHPFPARLLMPGGPAGGTSGVSAGWTGASGFRPAECPVRGGLAVRRAAPGLGGGR